MISQSILQQGTAIHEAAHAVVATLLGIPIQQVCVFDAESGVCYVDRPTTDSREEWRKHIVAALAGQTAQILYRSMTIQNVRRFRIDNGIVRTALEQMYDPHDLKVRPINLPILEQKEIDERSEETLECVEKNELRIGRIGWLLLPPPTKLIGVDVQKLMDSEGERLEMNKDYGILRGSHSAC